MAGMPPPPPGFTLDAAVPPPPPGFKLDTVVPPPPPGFKMDTPAAEPPADFSDVSGGSSSTNDTYWQGVKDRFGNFIQHPLEAVGEVLDRPLKPIRESLQQGGITGEMGPDIAKQAFGPGAGGFVEGVEKDVAPGLVSGENAAIMGGLAAAPEAAPFVLAHFGKQGAQQAIQGATAGDWDKLTPEEKGRRVAQIGGGAAMALAPIAHAVIPELSRFRRAAEEPVEAPRVEPELPKPGFTEEALRDFDEFAKGTELPAEIAKPYYEARAPEAPPAELRLDMPEEAPSYREIADAAKDTDATPLEIQQAADELRRLDEDATSRSTTAPEETAPTAVGSVGEANPIARSPEPPTERPSEAGDIRSDVGQGEGGPAAGGVEAPDLTHASIRDFQRQAGVPEYEGSRFSRSNQGIRDAVRGNEAALVERGKRAQVGEALSDEVQYALKEYTDNLVRNGGDPAEIRRNYQILAESGSAKGRQLQALQTAIENVDHTDPVAVVDLANKATAGKLSIQAQLDLRDMASKAREMKKMSESVISKRAEAALKRLEGMGEEIKRLTIKDVIGCR